MPEERLQKMLAHAGIASRRKAEQLILEGRVTVNGAVITELGTKADPERDHIKVDGKRVGAPERPVYLAMNKPKNCVTTVSDPEGRPTVMDLLRGVKARVYPVGRLDYHSEGLLLLTNDGEFAKRITSAASHVTKTYLVKTNGPLTPEQEEQFRQGVPLSGKKTAPAGLKLIQRAREPVVRSTIDRRAAKSDPAHVQTFRAAGGEAAARAESVFSSWGRCNPGKFRHLTPAEVARFRKLAEAEWRSDSRWLRSPSCCATAA